MKKVRSASLTVSVIPFRSSNLTIPVSPFSPQLPLTPQSPPPSFLKAASIYTSTAYSNRTKIPLTIPPPKYPLNWIWQCHICHMRYPLAVTRRCLEDGHHFCAGTTVVKTKRGKNGERSRVVRRHKVCSSEFDYQGWKAWGEWRRNEEEIRKIVGDMIKNEEEEDGSGAATLGLGLKWQLERQLKEQQNQASRGAEKKDCWNKCDYPSECRWGNQLKQQQKTPDTPTIVPSNPPGYDSIEAMALAGLSTDEQIEVATPNMALDAIPATTFDSVLENIDLSPTQKKSMDRPAVEPPREAFWGALLASATRRKSAGSSHLALAPVLEQDEPDSGSSGGGSSPPCSAKLVKDASGDVEMADSSPTDSHSNYTLSSGPYSRSRTADPSLQIPSLVLGLKFGFEGVPRSVSAAQASAEKKGKEKGKRKKGYIGYVESLRRFNRSI